MTDATVDALTALVMIGTWPEAEAELLVRDVALVRLETVAELVELQREDDTPRFAVIDVDAPVRLDAALALLQSNRTAGKRSLRIAFVASEGTAMLSRVGQAFTLGLAALFEKPCAPAALFRKLELLGIPVPLAPAATLRPAEPIRHEAPTSPRARMSLPPLGIRERPSSIPAKLLTEPSPSDADRIPPPPAPPRSVGSAARSALAAAGVPSTRGGPLLAGLSPELRELLSEAEERAEWYGEEFALPSPEEEVEAVLPKAVLEALEEPIDAFDDDDELPPSLLGSPPAFESSEETTGVGHGDTDFGTRRDLRGRSAPSASDTSLPPAEETTGVGTAERPLTGIDRDVPTPRPPTALPRRPALESEPPPPTPPRSRPALRSPRPSPRPMRRPTPRPSPRPMPSPVPSLSRRQETALGSPGDSLVALAEAAARGFDGILEFRGEEGVRVVRFLRGDVSFAASHVAGEGLADFLAVRGEMSKEKATRLARRMPTFGRFAAAALVASGVLAKDDMWTVLRAHAAFVLDNIARLEEGTRIETSELGRLADEPPVFGASTGAEVIMDTIRRTVAESDARARLGGMRGRLHFGPGRALLAECGIEEPALRAIEQGEGQRLDALASSNPGEFATIVYGLTLLGVVTLTKDLRVEEPEVESEEAPMSRGEDSLDDEALRAAILARSALVDEGDYFALLGIHRGATTYEIRRAFLDLRRKFEPARALRPRTLDLKEDLRRILDVLEEAYEILGDGPRRERYLRALELPPA